MSQSEQAACADEAFAPALIRPTAADETTTSLWVVAGLAAAPAIAQGFGRFAYALVLPAMRDDLGWSYADAGAMSTANAVGYLIGALVAAPIAARAGVKRTFVFALVISALAIASAAAAPHYWTQAALRLLAGLAGGLSFVVGGSLAAAAAAGGGPSRAPTALGVYVAGGGLGIALSAVAVPPIIAEAGWRGGWIALGALSLLACLVAVAALGRAPDPSAAGAGAGGGGFSIRRIRFVYLAYGLMGAGYIAYATFVIAFLTAELAFTPTEISAFWAALGAAAIGSTWAWGPVLGRLRGGWGLVATAGAMAIGVALVLVEPSRPGAFVSAVLFGGSGFAAITAVTTLARRMFPPHAWTAAIGSLTVSVGVGQIVGPILCGVVSDGPQGLRAGLALSVWILIAGIAVASLQRETPPESAAA